MVRETDNTNDTLPAGLTERAQRILRDADLCVKCGLCLAHCPTYLKSYDEGDCPRGRIALAQGLASGELPVTARVQAHLGGCLVCRACETVCPSEVPYGRIIDAARAEMAVEHRPGPVRRLLRWAAAEGVVRQPWVTALAVRSLALVRRLLIRRATRPGVPGRPSGVMRAVRYLPPVSASSADWQPFYPAAGQERGRVALFLGCVARTLDRQTLDAAIGLLTRWGYGVYVPPGQGCCGALYQHDGAPEAAVRLVHANLEAFADEHLLAVVTTASGCGATLVEYSAFEGLSEVRRAAATRFASKVVDISRFLASRPWPPGLQPVALRERVAVQEPCTLRHGMGQGHGACDLLRRIPQLDVVELPDNSRCCGAAGVNMLTHPAMADSLGTDKLVALAETRADKLVSSNIGCALHLAALLRASGRDIGVLHPAVLLARQLDR